LHSFDLQLLIPASQVTGTGRYLENVVLIFLILLRNIAILCRGIRGRIPSDGAIATIALVFLDKK